MGNHCGKILWEILAGKSCGKILWENLPGNYCGKKTYQKLTMLVFIAIFRPITTIKTLQKYFYVVEEVLNFDLVDHMWKLVKNWFQ